MLTFYGTGIIVLLVLISFVSSTFSSIIVMDKLLLIAMGLSPFMFMLGAVFCAVALIKCRSKTAAVIGIVLNLILLVGSLYFFAAPFLVELRMLS